MYQGVASGVAGIAADYLYGRARRAGFKAFNRLLGAKGMVAGGSYTGKFRGRVKRPAKANLSTGYHEHVVFSGAHDMANVNYLGITSYPSLSVDSNAVTVASRMFIDGYIAILRYYFRHVHLGRWEFESPDQPLSDLIILTDTNSSAALGQFIQQKFMTPNGTIDTGTAVLITNLSTTMTIRSLATTLANECYNKWSLGFEPYILYSYSNGAGSGGTTYDVPGAMMFLNNLILKLSSTTVIRIQNQTVGDDGSNYTTDISTNPLHGKIFYFKDLSPTVGTGFDLSSTVSGDEWFAKNMCWPTAGTLKNVYATSVACPGSSAWSVIPKAQYFKNCTGVKDVQLNPGEIKEFKLRFKFDGRITQFLSRDWNNFSVSEVTNLGMRKGMGQCAIIALQRRLRAGDDANPISLSYQVDTYCRARIKKLAQRMTYHVETNAT